MDTLAAQRTPLWIWFAAMAGVLAGVVVLVVTVGGADATLVAFAFGELGVYVAIGLAFGVAEFVWPARSIRRRTDLPWDVLGLLLSWLAWGPLLDLWFGSGALEGLPTLALEETLPAAATAVLPLLCLDFMYYWGHRLLHYRGFWRTHRWHHMPSAMYWLAGNRTTLVHEFALFSVPGLVITLLFGRPDAAPLFLLFVVVFVFNHFTHCNLDLGNRTVERVFVTPRTHRVHHARDWAMSNSNFGLFLTVWDRLFGTWTDPEEVSGDYPVGEESPDHKMRARAILGI